MPAGPGAVNTAGVYLYGEDDPASSFSDLLNRQGLALTDVLGPDHAAWTAYTPTWAGITLGNGITSASYLRVGKTVQMYAQFQLGTTSAVTGPITCTLPVQAKRNRLVGTGTARPTGAGGNYLVIPYSAAATTLVSVGVLGTAGLLSGTTATVPATWAATGWLALALTYEAA